MGTQSSLRDSYLPSLGGPQCRGSPFRPIVRNMGLDRSPAPGGRRVCVMGPFPRRWPGKGPVPNGGKDACRSLEHTPKSRRVYKLVTPISIYLYMHVSAVYIRCIALADLHVPMGFTEVWQWSRTPRPAGELAYGYR